MKDEIFQENDVTIEDNTQSNKSKEKRATIYNVQTDVSENEHSAKNNIQTDVSENGQIAKDEKQSDNSKDEYATAGAHTNFSVIKKGNEAKDVLVKLLLWIPAVLIMVAIFWFSSQYADDSAQLSGGFLEWLEKVFHIAIGHNLLRKYAHFFEFCLLGMTVSLGFFSSLKRTAPIASLVSCFIYALSDEIHQIFVPGRACKAFDVFIDLCGGALGILVFVFVAAFIGLIKNRKKNSSKQ